MTTPDHQKLEVSRLIKADRGRVFAAWTDPDMIVQWWGAGDVRCTAAEIDLTVGGAYRIANRTPDGNTMWITGTFEQIDPPSSLAYTWATEPTTELTEYSLVEVRFDSLDGGTLVTIVHTKIPTAEAREINLYGWMGCLDGLDALLTT